MKEEKENKKSNILYYFFKIIYKKLDSYLPYIFLLTIPISVWEISKNSTIAPENIINFLITVVTFFTISISFLYFFEDYKSKILSNENSSSDENSNLGQEINDKISDILNKSQIDDAENLKKIINDIISQNKILKDKIQQPNIEKQLISNIEESKVNAERLFKRSNYSLIVGGTIAISGVLIFYILNLNTDYNKFTDLFHFLGLIPRFGILFFIEYVAFFFLKQYRVLMEEYRYYEAIKRDRQNLLSLYYLVDKYKDEKDILELINTYFDKHAAEIPRYSGDNRVKMEKSLNEDMDLISKIIKMIQVIKSTDKSKA